MTSLLLSEQFVISAGCIVFRPSTGEICLVKSTSPHSTSAGHWLLPKGRKNVGETIADAAVREAHEETGCECVLWAVDMLTRATPPEETGRVEDVERVVRCAEPLAVQQRQTKHGHQKIIFWYIAQVKEGSQQRALEPHEHYEVAFFKYDEAIKKLTFDHDREIVRRAVSLVREHQSRTQRAPKTNSI